MYDTTQNKNQMQIADYQQTTTKLNIGLQTPDKIHTSKMVYTFF